MNNLIYDLWYGKLEEFDGKIEMYNDEHIIQTKQKDKLEKQIEKSLKDNAAFAQYGECLYQIYSIEKENAFLQGIKLGISLMTEISEKS